MIPALSFLFNPSCPLRPSCSTLPVQSFLMFNSFCPIPPVQSFLSNPSCPILPVQSFLSNPFFPIFIVICHSSLIQWKLYIYWHWRRHNRSSYFKINPAQKLSNLSIALFCKTKQPFWWIPYVIIMCYLTFCKVNNWPNFNYSHSQHFYQLHA